jgi:hypothetical protein
VQLRNTNTLVVSVDTIHEACSTSIVDSSEVSLLPLIYSSCDVDIFQEFKPRISAFELVGEDLDGGAVWKPQKDVDSILIDLNEQSTVEWHEKALQTLLYSVENLRKRSGEEHEGPPEP